MSEPVRSEDQVQEQPSSQPGQVRRPRPKTPMFADPLVRALTFIAVGLVVLFLATVVSALSMGILNSSTPRTAAERDVDIAATAVQKGDHSPKAIAFYANSLAGVQKYGQAQEVIDNAPSSARGTASGDVELAQATLYFVQKDYKRAIGAANTTMKVIKTAYDAAVKQPGVNAAKSYGLDANYYAAELIKAMSQQSTKDYKGALASFNDYLSQNSMETNVLVSRGQVKLALGDRNGAKADFQAALKFDPSNESATAELKKIGAK